MAALVLHQRAALAHRQQPARVTAGQVDRIGRVPADLAAHGVGQLLRGKRRRPGGQVHQRPLVVAGQHLPELTCAGAERIGERLRDPSRVGVHEGQVPDRVTRQRRREFGDPGRLVPAGDLAEHAVDETRTCRVEFDAGLLDGGGHRGMLLDPGSQQLVCAQPQQVEKDRVDLVRRPFRRRGDHRVEQAAGAAGAVGQFGGEGGVPADDPALLE